MKYRKKPVVVEAVQLTPELFWDCYQNNKAVFGKFAFSGHYHPEDKTIYYACIVLDTLEGTMTANLGDWLVKGVKGEFYPVKNDIFLETYEAVADEKTTL